MIGLTLTGCTAGFGERARHGVTFYCPGAGNVDMGDAGLREGLARAGYRGEVIRFTWSVSFNPAIDQTVRGIAQLGGARLATYIQEYLDRYPNGEVSVVGLSAGTGVAVWALEALQPKYTVSNVVLLGSSLSSDYDIGRALRHVRGQIYNYYSPNDAVLAGPMKVFGTIDGKFMVDGAGAVGLHPPRGAERVTNIQWRPEFAQHGYSGGHTDCTSSDFVRHYVSRHIVTAASAGLLDTPSSRHLLAVLRGERPATLVAIEDPPPVTPPFDSADTEAASVPEDVSATVWSPPAAPTGLHAEADESLVRLMRVMRGETLEPTTPDGDGQPTHVAAARRLLVSLEGRPPVYVNKSSD